MVHFQPMSRSSMAGPLPACATVCALVCCLSLTAQAPQPGTDPDGAARLLSYTGQISVERSGYAWALNVGSVVKRQEVIVTGPDGWGVFQVADGSKFEVFQNSRVVFRAEQGDWRRLLEVWLGKVRVQIEHFGGLPNNNQVRTPTAVISVRGTVFSVEVEDQTETTTVVDEEGSVSVVHALKFGAERVLTPGEYIRVYRNEPLAKSLIDKNGMLQRVFHAASDAAYQAAVNGRTATAAAGHVGSAGSPGGAADKNNGGSAPPPPPPPPPAPPH
jgi:ferric-dicitrate binding protein FerR (iron transport regulator)